MTSGKFRSGLLPQFQHQLRALLFGAMCVVCCWCIVYTTPCSLGCTVLLGKLHGHGLCFELLIQHGNKRKEAHFEGFGGTGIAQTRQRKAPRCGSKVGPAACGSSKNEEILQNICIYKIYSIKHQKPRK